jgi:hypothetical protein
MRYLSLLRDSVRESLDRRSFIITLVACLILILACAAIGFEPLPMTDKLQRQVGQVFRYHHEKRGAGYLSRYYQALDYRVTKVREADGGWTALIDAKPVVEFQKLVLFFEGARSGAIQKDGDPIPGLSTDGRVERPPSRESMAAFIESRMPMLLMKESRATIEEADERRVAIRISFRLQPPNQLLMGHQVNVLFGTWVLKVQGAEPRVTVFEIQKLLAGVIVGWVGILASIVLTASFIPNMLQKGNIDLILSRPVTRWSVLLLKYLGGLSYVTATAVFLIGGCWLALGFRSGSWSPGFLMAIPLLVFFFAAVYAVSAFIGVTKANPTEAIMVAIFAWLALTSLGAFHDAMHTSSVGIDPNGTVGRIVSAAHTVTPPLGEIHTAVSWFLMKANGVTPAEIPGGRGGSFPDVRWVQLFGVTGAWMALLLGLSCWFFSRRDY